MVNNKGKSHVLIDFCPNFPAPYSLTFFASFSSLSLLLSSPSPLLLSPLSSLFSLFPPPSNSRFGFELSPLLQSREILIHPFGLIQLAMSSPSVSTSTRSRKESGKSSSTPSSSSNESFHAAKNQKPVVRSKPLGVVFLLALGLPSLVGPFLVSLKIQTALLTVVWALLGSLSDSAGYHRLWAHKSYEAALPLKLFFALFGAANCTGSVINWARNHRAHHRQADTPRVRISHSLFTVFGFGCFNLSLSLSR